MPAYAIREWRQEEKSKALPEQIIETIDSCEDVAKTAKSRLKKFLAEMGIQDILEMDYPLRKAYQNYLLSICQIQSADRYLLAYDRAKQADIRRRMKTLAGKNQCRWRLEETILFLPYHPDQELAMELDSVRNRPNMVWDFTKPCAWHVKEQVFTTLNEILAITKNSIQRRQRLTGLQYLYDFCTEQAIQDIEDMDLAQEQMFDAYLTEHTPSETYKHQMLAILNLCRKTVFLHNAQINWQANIWYLDGLRIAEHRLNRSSSVTSVSFTEISHKENRRYAKEYMKYQIGVTGQAISTITTRYCLLERFLVRLSEQGQDAASCTTKQIEDYLGELQESGISAKSFNAYISGLNHFFRFLIARNYRETMPFQPELYQKKIIVKHHDRSVSPEVCEEVLGKLHLLPDHLRCMYLHLWCLGLRISEVCTLKGNAYYRQNHDTWIQVYQVKMKNYKRIPIAEGLYRIMEVYIKTHQIGPDDYLFTNKNGGPYRSMTFRHQMKKFCEDHEIDGGDYLFQSHDYRHTVATMLYDNGVSIQGVRDYLGHDYLEMTEQYIDYMPKKIAKENMGFFQKPEHNLAAGLRKKGGRDGK